MLLTPPTDTAAQASIIDRVFSDAPTTSPASPSPAQSQDPGAQAAEGQGQAADLAPAGQNQAASEVPAAGQPQAPAPTETQIPLSALLALMQAGALPGAVQPPAAPPPPAPKLKEQIALDAFYDDRTRAEVVKHVLGGHYQPGAETNPTALATVEAFLTSQARNATLEARLASFEAAQTQAQVQASQAQAQQHATNLFQAELAKFDTPNPALQETLADLVYSYQLQGYSIPQATQAAFERGKQLGLRLKGAQGRPSNQQRVVSGKDTAQRVVSMPTGTQSQAPTQASPRSINDVLKAAFSGR